ncbi:hypothetical protein B0J14DRAFT_671760 [Halenospora varia]|nr:hypothetical protein B0J14DRAFT_671760 [Halenospora varia]
MSSNNTTYRKWLFSIPTKNFTIFSKLPTELRLRIWEATVAPRIVFLQEYCLDYDPFILGHVRSDTEVADSGRNARRKNIQVGTEVTKLVELHRKIQQVHRSTSKHLPLWNLAGLKSKCPVPTLFYICRESYSVALRLYPQCFPTLGNRPKIHFNPNMDYLHIRKESFLNRSHCTKYGLGALSFVTEEDRSKVQHLSINLDVFHSGCRCEHYSKDWFCKILSLFGGVQKVTFVITNRDNPFRAASGTIQGNSDVLIFVDHIDLWKLHVVFAIQDYHEQHPQNVVKPMHWNARVDEKDFETARLEHLKKKGVKWFPKPLMEYKLIATRAKKAIMEVLQQRYEKSPNACLCYENGNFTPANSQTSTSGNH